MKATPYISLDEVKLKDLERSKANYDGGVITTYKLDWFEKGYIFKTLTIKFNPKGDTSVYCVGGGSSFPTSKHVVRRYKEIFSSFEHLSKLVYFGHNYANIREFDLKTGDLLIKLIEQTKLEEITPDKNVVIVGYSAGSGPAVNFLCSLQRSEYLKPVERNLRLLLLEPVGLYKDKWLLEKCYLLPISTLLFRLKEEKNIKKAFKKTGKEIEDCWSGSVLEMIKDVIFGNRKYLEEESKKYRLNNLSLPVSVPFPDLVNCTYLKDANSLTDPIKIKIVIGNHGIDPFLDSISNHEGKRGEEIKKRYLANVFKNINSKYLDIYILRGAHTTIFSRYLSSEIRNIISKK